MASADNLKNTAKETQEILGQVLDAVSSIGDKLIQSVEEFNDELVNSGNAVDIVGKTIKRSLSSELKQTVKNTEDLVKLQLKASKGEAKASDIAKQRQKIEENRALLKIKQENLEKNMSGLSKEQMAINGDLLHNLELQLDEQEQQLKTIEEIQDKTVAQGGLTKALVKNAKDYLTQLDKSGIAAAVLGENLSASERIMLGGEAALLAIAKGALDASANTANLAKETGISYNSARALQAEFALTALNTGKAFINSKRLNESFRDLVKETGLLSTYGGDTLATMTTLTKQLGLGSKEASQLSLLARTQSTDTESVLENTVNTVNAINRQNRSAVSAKAVLNDIATASKSIVVSLGMSPEILAEAATEARALGLNLESVDRIASSLLDFESSIAAELEAELLLGKEINFEQARLYALNNDMAGLTREIADNTAITAAFASNNRIQQEAAAAALGMSREDLANMVYQQELLSLGQDEFIAKYGEQTYQSMQSQSAAEKFKDAMEKVQSIIGDIALVLSPVVDALAWMAESTVATYTVLGLIAGLSLAKTLGSLATMAVQLGIISAESITANAALTFGLGALAVGAAVALMLGTLSSAKKSATQQVQDGIAPSGNGPFTITDAYGRTAITAKGDGVAVSPNISRGGSDTEMVSLLRQIAAKDNNINMDSRKLNDSMSTSTTSYSIGS